ncbi:hypothetical protein VTO73DRAFT_940 [Trametes versicolor]
MPPNEGRDVAVESRLASGLKSPKCTGIRDAVSPQRCIRHRAQSPPRRPWFSRPRPAARRPCSAAIDNRFAKPRGAFPVVPTAWRGRGRPRWGAPRGRHFRGSASDHYA